jgi:uncharacterized protein YegP (UPF0339 family)
MDHFVAAWCPCSPPGPEVGPAEGALFAMIRYEIHKGSGYQPYWWRAVSVGNDKVLCKSENYYNKSDAQHAVDLMKAGSASAQVVDKTGQSSYSSYYYR